MQTQPTAAALAAELLSQQPPAAAAYNRRMLDPTFDGSGQLTISHADLADAVRRTLQCAAPAITQGVWNILRSEAQRRADTAEAERVTGINADWRARRQIELETLFTGQSV